MKFEYEHIKWVAGFLMKWKVRVVVDATMSDGTAVDSGVLQGIVLGPLQFLSCIDDSHSL